VLSVNICLTPHSKSMINRIADLSAIGDNFLSRFSTILS